ncbi:hypothetical protein MC7420_3646 [Coleofasciculus chthonoplastes PCC 7420]|uniref:Uncharacterized protein n=1 Tax=Coleofasciculus chthonoplastes PCC 7420 TaxID=118168 RepID=B4VX35_9CYAN|nr:hypothetical protein MC7420_3646 [Coleofasciculus chthonoplastes PCC 7420]
MSFELVGVGLAFLVSLSIITFIQNPPSGLINQVHSNGLQFLSSQLKLTFAVSLVFKPKAF